MRGTLAALTFALAFAPISFGQAASSDPDLTGTWTDTANAGLKLILNEKGDGKIQVRQMDGDKVVADYSCDLTGKECDIKEDGHPVKVMIYYNGSKLIEIMERGSDVEKRRFSLSQDGKTMEVETIPISSTGNSSTNTYRKEDSQVAKNTQ
ncbi:MAG TPA: hypothetical protein VFA65_08115 [Bryobacteraceae bacterium]|nr:hypothetical protein [Bryobacteraceae bacterium]